MNDKQLRNRITIINDPKIAFGAKCTSMYDLRRSLMLNSKWDDVPCELKILISKYADIYQKEMYPDEMGA